MNKLGEINKFLGIHKLPELIQEEMANMNSYMSIKEIEIVAKIFPTKKTLDPNVFTGEFYWSFKKEITSFLHKLFQKTRVEETFPTCYKDRITLRSKQKSITQTEICRVTSLRNIGRKIFNIILKNWANKISKR